MWPRKRETFAVASGRSSHQPVAMPNVNTERQLKRECDRDRSTVMRSVAHARSGSPIIALSAAAGSPSLCTLDPAFEGIRASRRESVTAQLVGSTALLEIEGGQTVDAVPVRLRPVVPDSLFTFAR